MNYIELKSEVTDFSHRTDLDTKMDSFVLFAEAEINKDLRALDMERRLPVSFTDAFYSFPNDYMELRAIEIDNSGARVPIRQYSPQNLDAMYSRATGTVRGFAVHGGQMELRPAPSIEAPVTGELSYFARVSSLTGTDENVILTKFPLIYLSAMLVQVYIYLQDESELAIWQAKYNTQVSQANKSAQGGRYYLPQVM